MKKRKFLKNNTEKTGLIKKISWLKGRTEAQDRIIRRLFKKRNEKIKATRDDIYIICSSYESGFGHGVANDGLDLSRTPHSDEHLGQAYQIGYEAGLARYKAAKEYEKNLVATN